MSQKTDFNIPKPWRYKRYYLYTLARLFTSIFINVNFFRDIWYYCFRWTYFCGWLCPQTIFRVFYWGLIETTMVGLRKNISTPPSISALQKSV